MAKSKNANSWTAENLYEDVYVCTMGELRIKRRRSEVESEQEKMKEQLELGEGDIEFTDVQLGHLEGILAAMDSASVNE